MTRKRQQGAGKPVPTAQNEIVPTGASAGSSGAQATSALPHRQARTAKGNRANKKTESSHLEMLKLPVELFTEIMSHLRPIDVLNLSRTSKSLRKLLMRRSSEPIWDRAAQNLPYRLHACPPWLDMPQYVSVVYTDACSECGGKAMPKRCKMDPEFQPVLITRLCVDCQAKVYIPVKDIPKNLTPFVIITHVNIYSGSGSGGIKFAAGGEYALRAEVLKFEKEFKANIEKFGDLSDPLMEWLHAKRIPLQNHINKRHWDLIEDVERDRETQRNNIKLQFEKSVKKRLRELGWEYDLTYVGGKEWDSLAKQPRELTDRIWKNLYVKLQPIMEEARSWRLKQLPFWKQEHLIKLWKEKHQDLGTHVIVHHQHVGFASARLVPPLPEAMNWPYIKQILDSCPSRRGMKDLLLASWEGIRPLIETWQLDVESKLANRLREDSTFTRLADPNANALTISGQAVSEDLTQLLRADSVFQLADNTIRYFPDGFQENWNLREYWLPDPPSVTSSSIVEGARPFTLARDQAKRLLHCLGHSNASHLGMISFGRRFVCGKCADGVPDTEYSKIYDWKELLAHYTDIRLIELEHDSVVGDRSEKNLLKLAHGVHSQDISIAQGYPLVYTLSTDDARKYGEDTTKMFLKRPWADYKENYVCVRCAEGTASNLSSVLFHVQAIHNVEDPEAHRDYKCYEHYLNQSMEATYEYGCEPIVPGKFTIDWSKVDY